MAPTVEEVLKQRGEEYGDAENCHRAIGQTWAGILTQHIGCKIEDIPPHIVSLMMVAFKCVRAANPNINGYNQDNYIDIHGYATIAEIIAAKDHKRVGPVE